MLCRDVVTRSDARNSGVYVVSYMNQAQNSYTTVNQERVAENKFLIHVMLPANKWPLYRDIPAHVYRQLYCLKGRAVGSYVFSLRRV